MESQQRYAANSFNKVAQMQLMNMISPLATKVLDLGCGDGQTSRMLQELLPNAKVYGLTANKEEAETNSDDQLKIVFGDAHHLPFEDNFFDVVYARHVLEHCIAPYIAIKELNRVLSLGGQVVIAVPENNEWADSYPDHYSVLSKTMWEKLFVQCGFKVKQSLKGSWFAWGAAAELPELRFELEKTSDLATGKDLVHVFTPKVGEQLVDPPQLITQKQLVFVFHNLVTYESLRNVLIELSKREIEFDIIVPTSNNDNNAQRMFEDTARIIKREFPNVRLGVDNLNTHYKIAFYPFLPFFFSVDCDYVVRYQYGIGKASYNFDVWSMNFDYILCQSPYDYKALRNYTQAKLLGNPKFIKEVDRKSQSEKFSILYMPTYGELSSIDDWFDFIKTLSQKYYVRIKLHHMTLYYEPERVTKIKEIFKDEDIFTHEHLLSTLYESTDLVISDTSGAIFDSVQYGVPVAIIKKNQQVYQEEQISLEELLVSEGKVTAIYQDENLDKIESIRANYNEYYEKVLQLKKEIFPIKEKDALENYCSFILNLLNDNVDKTALIINRKKQSYLHQLDKTVVLKTKLLENLEETYELQKQEILSLLNEYKVRVGELSEQVVKLDGQNLNKDTRIMELSKKLNSVLESQTEKDNRIRELSETIVSLQSLQIEKDARIQELSENVIYLKNKLALAEKNNEQEEEQEQINE
ncbi:methyltransferase domain-containing protein [Paenibacillus phoenicis]|uniref:Methyltransferase domain-containing protein n=2 Tax=Paenibacillus phoenicis TaxID=554117 RepID=A0ABU5PMW0_9BACL|nr:methyltransferase domain-containing protein [Paenibacillus phoenicis]MEA3571283.1 methyltransferase domain-containing protein [Paenibacillus phoenicis]